MAVLAVFLYFHHILTFDQFHFDYDILDGLHDMGFETPTPIQEMAIPIIQKGRDLIGCAQTGTGKTAAFLLPVLDKLAAQPTDKTDTLIIVPTRELALQIDQALQGFSYYTGVSSAVIYGGGDGQIFEREKRALSQGANVIIATPGRLMSHLNLGHVKLGDLKHLILDEADRMLNMGFIDDIMRIITYLPEKRQTLMFSATMPQKIRDLAKRLLKDPEQISLALSKPAEGVTQGAYLVHDTQKTELIARVLKEKNHDSVIIFASTRQKVKDLEKALRRAGITVAAIHSDLIQAEREEVLLKFRSKKLPVLVATDVLSRGIDIEDIGMVINFDVPHDAEDYVHRVGRTARAESTGEAITFINEKDQRNFKQIEQLIGYEIPKLPLPEGMSAGPEWNPLKKIPREPGKKSGKNFRHKKK